MKHQLFCSSLILSAISSASATVIINDDFDDGTVTGWSSLGNGLGADHNISESGSNLTSEVIANQPNRNTHRGVVSDASFDPASEAGFSMTVVVSSQGPLTPGANGMFLGVTNDNATFFRTDGVASFGLTFFGHPTRTESNGGLSLVTNDIGANGSATEGLILGSAPGSIQLASFQDGFTATLGADPSGWSYTVTGISDPSGTATSLSDSGTWADAGTDYASVFTGSDWHALASNQGDPAQNSHTLVLDEISLTVIPEPSTGLLGLMGLMLATRRRR